jgi:hypothetical protein
MASLQQHRNISFKRHTAIVTGLLNSSTGDLSLNAKGHLCTQHDNGTPLAVITNGGWVLTSEGAEYMLCNEIFKKSDLGFLRDISSFNDAHLFGLYI